MDCRIDCTNIFTRIAVFPVITGGTRILWELTNQFRDPTPHFIQLQVGMTLDPNATDWTNVGSPVADVSSLIDSEKRAFGSQNWTSYRLILSTTDGTYTSQPFTAWGYLSRGDFRIAREIMRQERLVANRWWQEGAVLPRLRSGTPCSGVDPQTGDCARPSCTECLDTGFVGGYFNPMYCVPANLEPESTGPRQDLGGRGSTADIAVPARLVGASWLFEKDVWVSLRTARRYSVDYIKNVAAIRGTPIIDEVTLNFIPFSDAVYCIPVEGLHGLCEHH